MKNKKGMTLIEVILALFLLGLITVVFLPSTWASYKMMGTAKDITGDLFLMEQKMEREMEKARDLIYEYEKDNALPNPMPDTIMAFGKTIKGISIEQPKGTLDPIFNEWSNRGKFYTFIAEGRVPKEDLPEIEWVKLNNRDKLDPIHWYGNSLKGSFKVKDTTNYFMSLKRWYVSKRGFDGHIPDVVNNESHWGTRYPSWPNDYELLSNDRDLLDNLKDYYGKHIVYSSIPISKTSKYGMEQPSKPVYVRGLPILSNLFLHLDTSLLDLPDVPVPLATIIDQWDDLDNHKKAITSHGDGVQLQYENGKFLTFKKDSLVIEAPGNNGDQLTIFVVFKNTSTDSGKFQNIISRNSIDSGWKLSMEGGKIELLVDPVNPMDPMEPAVDCKLISANEVGQGKHIITAKISTNDIQMIIDKEGGHETLSVLRKNPKSNDSNLKIGIGDSQSEQNIYEIIIYNSALSAEDTNIIRRYLSEKHRVKIAQ